MRSPDSGHPSIAPLIVAVLLIGSSAVARAADEPPVRAPVIERRMTPTPTPRLRPDEPLIVPTATPTPHLRIDEPLIVSTPTMSEQPQLDVVTPTPTPPTANTNGRAVPEGLAVVGLPELSGVAEAYGEAAMVRWRAPRKDVLRVDFGTTDTLDRHAIEDRSLGTSPLPVPGPNDPAEESVEHEVRLDGLQTGGSYFYRATLSEYGQDIAQTDVREFRTKHPVIKVDPYRIDVNKDGDNDWFGKNPGEVLFEWWVHLDHELSGAPPPGDASDVTGCYPGGADVKVDIPDGGVALPGYHNGGDQGLDGSATGLHQPGFGDQPQQQPLSATSGCAAYGDDLPDGYLKVVPHHARVNSGGLIELSDDPIELTVPDGLPQVSGPSGAVQIGPIQSGAGQSQLLAAKGKGMPNSAGGTSQGSDGGAVAACSFEPPPPACITTSAPKGAMVMLFFKTRGQEIDVYSVPSLGSETVLQHDVEGFQPWYFDLREPAPPAVMIGVHVSDGDFAYTIWFQTELQYR